MKRLVIGLVVVVALLVLGRLLDVQHWVLAFVAYVRGAGVAGMLLFAAAYVLATVLFVPGLLLTMGAGLAYGLAVGAPLVWVSANLAAAAAFLLGRTLARDAIAARVQGDPRFSAIDSAVVREGSKSALLTRLSPAFPFNLLNYAYGLTRVTFRDYVAASLVGMIPGTVMYVYLGSLLTDVAQLAGGGAAGGAPWWLKAIGFVATLAVTIVVTRIARRALHEATEGRPPAANAASAPPQHAAGPLVRPDDQYNRALLTQVHPPGRRNPKPAGRYNLVVVGGGTAGLVSAAGGAGLGAKVALVERALLGGDCLNVGCVPSKALIAAARAAADARAAGALGVRTGGAHVDFPAVMERMRRLRAGIAANDSVERFTKLGVDVYVGQGTFTSPTSVDVDGQRLEFAKAVIATGARAASLDIPGLEEAGYLTNE